MTVRVSRQPIFSLIVPTRQRIGPLARLLKSLAATAAHPLSLEVVLVVDADDRASIDFAFGDLPVRRVIVEPGSTMGALNTAGYEGSSGDYLMLLNDDVVCRTSGWDQKVLACFRDCADGILLVHPNDTVFEDKLCTFPIVSRTFCELAAGICPRSYVRYRIDDHIEDVFNLLGILGERRIIYLPDVVFEHLNFVVHPAGLRQYFSDEQILAVDAPQFEALLPDRKELALKLKQHIVDHARREEADDWRRRLEAVQDSSALRVAGPQRLVGRKSSGPGAVRSLPAVLERLRVCVRRKGWRGLTQAVWKRVVSWCPP
jgi:hypothetical protein